MQTTLPLLDEHATEVAAGPEEVWRALLEGRAEGGAQPAARLLAVLLRCDDRTSSGPRPLARGSVVPGFRVSSADPGRLLVLEGRHRFARYALTFRIDRLEPGETRLSAETRAAFPGATGGAYHWLLTTLGLHGRAVRAMLASTRRRAETATVRGN